MQKSKAYRASQEHRDLYDALVKSHKPDKDLFESYGKAYSLKRDREDKDKDEEPPVGSDQRPQTPDPYWNAKKSIDFRPPQTWISKISEAEKPPLTFDELMSTPIDFSAYVMNNLKNLESVPRAPCDFPRLNLRDIEDMLLLLVQKKLSNLERDVIFDLNMALQAFRSDISKRTPYTLYNNPQGFIYVDEFKRNKLMCSDEFYKFSDGTLTSVRYVLHDIVSNLRMDYLPKRR
nr:hypothetical protein [Tanacetum cinerariifolium]